MTNKSIAISPFTMPAALAAADSLLGNPTWSANPDNPDQVRWLESFRRRAGIAYELPEIHRNATLSAADHAAWLRAEGWDAQITQGTPDDVFLAATINIVAQWKEAGRAYKDGVMDRVILKKGATAAYGPGRDGRLAPVVTVSTQHTGYAFLFQQLDRAPIDEQHLLAHVLDAASRPSYDEVQLDFPMVDLHVKDDARYMIGLQSGPNIVSQAAEALKLELNETGGRASAAAEVAVSRGMGPEAIRITGPFAVAVVRVGVANDSDRVAFAAYVERDAWRRPGAGRI